MLITAAARRLSGIAAAIVQSARPAGGEHDLTENIIHLVLARIDGGPSGTKGLSLFIVPKLRDDGASNDVKVASIEHKMGLNGSATCVINFGYDDGCRGELVGGVQQTHERAADRLTRAVNDAAGDHGLLLEVDAGGQRQSLLRCRAHINFPTRSGLPRGSRIPSNFRHSS